MSTALARGFLRPRTTDGSDLAYRFTRRFQLRFFSRPSPSRMTSVASKPAKLFSGVSKDDLFAYKAQRWLWNESQQLKSRYVQFDLAALVEVAEEAVGNDAEAMNVAKLPEGNFNKAFLVTMVNGREVVVKIPNPNAGRGHYTTASEVATMRYVRDKLQIPAPQALAYCSRAEKSKLGAEYIVMEKASGIELNRVWDNLNPRKKLDVVGEVAAITSRLGNARFPQYGSIYYRTDLDLVEGTIVDEDFVIGPTNARSWFDDRRRESNMDRGPWTSSVDLMNALVQREMTCLKTLQKLSLDRCQGIYNGPSGYHPTREAKVSVLQDFLQVIQQILPKEDSLNSGVMWHQDLHSANIFVDEIDNSKITNIIDWQAVPVYPTFLHVDHPSLIEYDGEKPETFQKPVLPANIKELEPDEKEKAKARFVEQTLWTSYEIQVQQVCPALVHAFRHRHTLPGQILGLVGSTFDDGEPHVQSLLVDVSKEDIWKILVGEHGQSKPKILCPLRYSEDEIRRQRSEYGKWERDIERKAQVIEELGAYTGWDGAVLPEQYDDMVARLERAKQRFLDREANTPEERGLWEQAWPFRDGATSRL